MWLSLLCVSVPLFANEIESADAALAQGDYVRAVQIFEALSNTGNTDAMVQLASLYQRGEGVDRDSDKAVALYRAAAELGDAEAQFNLGNMYLLGEGLPRDEDWALTFYRLAAAQGHVPAEQNMLELYRANGIDSPPPYPQVTSGEAEVIESTDTVMAVAPPLATDLPPGPQGGASTAGPATPGNALDEAPMITLEAVEVPIETPFDAPSADEVEALRLAQEHGIEIELAEETVPMPAAAIEPVSTTVIMVESSSLQRQWPERLEGAKRALALENFEHGVSRLTRLAEDGYGEAALLLADMAERGEGMPADAGLAMMWRQRAADLGSAEAQYQLAERYLRGDGLDPDDAMAITYYRDAARGGHPMAQEKLRLIYADAGLPMPEFKRPREPIAIYSTAPSVRDPTPDQSTARESDAFVEEPDRSVIGDEKVSASPKEVRVIELFQPAKRLSKPDPVIESSSSPVADAARIRVVNPTVIVTHPPAHEPLVSESLIVLEPAKPEDHEVVPGSVLNVARTPAAEPTADSSGDVGAVKSAVMIDTTGVSSDGFAVDTLTAMDVEGSAAAERVAQAHDMAPSGSVAVVDVSEPVPTADERIAMVGAQTVDTTISLSAPVASGPEIPTSGADAAASSSAASTKGVFGRIKGFFSRDPGPVATAASEIGGSSTLVHIGPVSSANSNAAGAAPEAGTERATVVSTGTIDDGKRALAEGRFSDAVEIFAQLAERGDASAQAHLGYLYYKGEGVDPDLDKAIDWYRRAAVQGNRDAQYNLAVAYAFGEGVTQDDVEAVTWYRRAAEQGSAIAQYSLGVSYALGEGVMRDDIAAIKWYRAAAEQGYAAAQYNLGYSYRTGHGIEADDIEALQWFGAAARNGHASAQYSLGYMYRSGRGVPRNLDEAVKWYRLAAAQGHPDARADLVSLNPGG
jgi:TPR repeat protein